MTVTLSPDLAGLLDRTGHPWPDTDEDRLLVMAAGWGRLSTHLDTVRQDHAGSVQAVLAGSGGEAVSAFGEWASRFDGLLLQTVELCARAEAVLIVIARTVLEAKRSVLGTLDDLAHGIEQFRRTVADIPLVGGVLAEPVADVEDLVVTARGRIAFVLDAATDMIAGRAVPALVDVLEVLTGVVQDLRKLLKGEIGAAWPTTPSRAANPDNLPRGPQATPEPNDNATMRRSLRLENDAARILAQAGFDVEQIPRKRGQKTPDYLVEGEKFDCYAPTTASAFSIWSHVRKYKVDAGQAARVIIDIDSPDAAATVDDLRAQFQENPMPGLKEAKVIGPGGAIIDIYP